MTESVARVRGKRAQTKANNRQAILDAAKVVFGEIGYGATTVRDIIRGTDLASGTFYNYFTSKEEVFRAILDEGALELRPHLHKVRMEAKSLEDFIRGTFSVFFGYLLSDRDRYAMLRRNAGALRVLLVTPEVVAGFGELRSDIEEGMTSGIFPKVDVAYLSSAIIGISFEVGDAMLKKEKADLEATVKFATAMVVGGISTLASQSS